MDPGPAPVVSEALPSSTTIRVVAVLASPCYHGNNCSVGETTFSNLPPRQ